MLRVFISPFNLCLAPVPVPVPVPVCLLVCLLVCVLVCSWCLPVPPSIPQYALQCFEGMKAYKDAQGRVRLFRPEKNMTRMNSSMSRLSMPALDEQGYLECIKQVGALGG